MLYVLYVWLYKTSLFTFAATFDYATFTIFIMTPKCKSDLQFTFSPAFSYQVVFQCELMTVFVAVVVQICKLMDVVRHMMALFTFSLKFRRAAKIDLRHTIRAEL